MCTYTHTCIHAYAHTYTCVHPYAHTSAQSSAEKKHADPHLSRQFPTKIAQKMVLFPHYFCLVFLSPESTPPPHPLTGHSQSHAQRSANWHRGWGWLYVCERQSARLPPSRWIPAPLTIPSRANADCLSLVLFLSLSLSFSQTPALRSWQAVLPHVLLFFFGMNRRYVGSFVDLLFVLEMYFFCFLEWIADM